MYKVINNATCFKTHGEPGINCNHFNITFHKGYPGENKSKDN